MDHLLLPPASDLRERPVLAAIVANRHSITLGIIFTAHLLTAPLDEGRGALFGPMFLLVLYMAGFLLLGQRNALSVCILTAGSLALVGAVANFLGESPTLLCMTLVCSSVFDLLLIVFMLAWLFKQRKMPFDNIMAGIIVFMFMAALWTQLYALVCLATPGAVRGPEGGLGPHPAITLYYFSVATLTTAGFGDVVPVSDMARMLAAYEALIGQVYLVVFIALLMGRHFAPRAAAPGKEAPGAATPPVTGQRQP
ncbi:MAG TPA: potassium channel family protein [Solidesulfovibrio sp.]|jgi:hypothetical protein|nr:two pore domain potassium channel family protein [Desulfovibrio sp.]HML62216.1 potassium channel family protein [Solidesulfovibrio sp.]